jgi:ppGpp synthetase/RelA/SpoT-type nucleotidyltranferase
MTKRKEKLQEIYSIHFLKWEDYLLSISKKVSQQLHKNGLKFSTKSRIKNIESLCVKITQLENQNTGKNEKIKDLLGLRIIVPFLEDVEHIISILQNNFHLIEIERKSEGLSYREFAYDSVHLILSIDKENIIFPQYCISGCEIQIRTILQDAWAEVEHELIYKSDLRFYNESIRKKLAALNASLTLSDMIFQEIRDNQKELEKWGKERFQELKKKATQINYNNVPSLIDENLTSAKKHSLSTSNVINKNVDSILMQALSAHNLKDYKEAIALYSQVLDLNLDLKIRSIVYTHRGMANFMLQQELQALKDFEMSFQCDSTNYRALNNRALILRRMGHIIESLEDFKLSLELKENQPEVYYLRAQTNFETENYQRALEDLKLALKLKPKYKEATDLMKHVSNKIKECSKNPKNR